MDKNSGNFYIQNRKNMEIVEEKKKNDLDGSNSFDSTSSRIEGIVGIEGFNNKMTGLMEDGPVAEKNLDDFEELKKLQLIYNRRLQAYNQAVKTLAENSQGYISASNRNNNQFANTFLRDPTGAVGYVTDRGVWKGMPNPTMANSMQGKNGCPMNWGNAPTVPAKVGSVYSIANAPEGEIVKTGGASLIKGTSTISNQSCRTAGQNMYVTNPSETKNRRFVQCSQAPGSYQGDLGSTTINACAKRAEDMGSNVFQMGKNNGGGRGACYIGGGGRTRGTNDCPNVPGVGRMGKVKPGRHTRRRRGWWSWRWIYTWIPGFNTYATYVTSGANSANVGDTYHITDDLTKKKYPNSMLSGYGNEFELLSGYNSYGNDITSGSGLTVQQLKQKCIDTPGAAGFYVNGNNYWIKNANMWPRGKRQYTGGDLYIRNRTVNNNNSCGNEVDFSHQGEVNGYANAGFMNMSTTCGLGTISERDQKIIRQQYHNLTTILDQIHQKIVELSKEDVKLNKSLLNEYKNLKERLNTYEHTYKEIRVGAKLIKHNNALEEDSNLQMLSYNQKYILWSMLALGATAGTMKMMK
tara:strand:- start:37 stop:1770 length:1734 start_codon:yes stop_codon:yes gene_type:complete